MIIDTNVEAINFNGNTVDKLIYNGVEVWPKTAPAPDYTEVKYITMTTNGYRYYQRYIDTGITSSANSSLVIKGKMYCKGHDGSVFVGHVGYSLPSSSINDRGDFRIFGENYLFVDCGNGRYYNQYSSTTVDNKYVNFEWTTDFALRTSNLQWYYSSSEIFDKDQMTSWVGQCGYGTNYPPNNINIYIVMCYLKFKELQIIKDDVLVFDGHAALDDNNTPCVYDSVSNSYKYVQGTMSSDVIYEN